MPKGNLFPGLLFTFLFGMSACGNFTGRENAEIAEWIRQGYELMGSRDPSKRAIAETLLLSAWDDSKSLSHKKRSILALRLAHLLERNADPKRSWKLLQEAKSHGLIDSCNSTGTLEMFRCAEAKRLFGTLQYAFHSWPESETERDPPPCEGLKRGMDTKNASQCLTEARKDLEKSNEFWIRLRAQLEDPDAARSAPVQEIADALGTKLEGIKGQIDARARFTRLNLGLVLEESGEFDRLTKVFGVKPENCVEDNTHNSYECLHLARAKRDKGDLAEAKRLLSGAVKVTAPAELAWRARLVSATLELRNGNVAEVRRLLTEILDYRERDQQEIVKRGNPFFLDRRLTSSENGDDVLISVMLDSAEYPGVDTSLRRYFSSVFGSGEAFLAGQFAAWQQKDPAILESLASTVASGSSDWSGGVLAGDRRRAAFQKLHRVASGLGEPVTFNPGTSEEIWQKAWKNMGNGTELLAILQYRRFDYSKNITEAVGDMEYVAISFGSANSKPVIRRIGASSEWNRKIRTLRPGERQNSDVMAELSRALRVSYRPAQRLVIIAAGIFQQVPWAMLHDETGVNLLKRETAPIAANSLIEVAGWNTPGDGVGGTAAFLFANPDLQPMLPMIRRTGPLRAMGDRLTWTGEDEKNAMTERAAFHNLGGDVREFVGPSARESTFKQLVSPRVLHVRTHGAYLEDQVQVPVTDRSLMLFTPTSTEDGLFLSSEARMLRLGGTRLVTLAVCEAGDGRGRRNGPVEGFRRSFHFAGARTVLAPLWIVDSSRAASFLTDFMTAARSGPLDRALLIAQKQASLREQGQSTDWAGWVLSGDPSALPRQ